MDVLINNAGILRDISFKNMKDDDWDLIMKVHVKGAYKVRRTTHSQMMPIADSPTVYESSMATLQEAEVRKSYQHCLCSRSVRQLRAMQLLGYAYP